ncbi:MAG: phosphoenolpyruvate--protein phosphotransferase [Gemmatimonadetes bacterium]|nr:phosphoenolpyruvate--protein phosphotransferase [Gemmatimonadota bacterium]MYD25759.1 phosphoenolpyruvate--protein phosphotransferase [Gemmatimonadota bacterium]MYI98151.1 phosphoenolpyruvate--protein phosphotransferase [Gemmatimonadota bacterium]
MSEERRVLQGIPASPGIAIGRALVYNRRFAAVHQRPIPADGVEAEILRFRTAVDEALDDLTRLQRRIAVDFDQDVGKIFRAHQAVLEDPEVVDVTVVRIRRERINAEYIFDDVMRGWIASYSSIENPYFRERTADFEDVQYRVLAKLTGSAHIGIEATDGEIVLVAHSLSPSDTAEIDRSAVCGFITDAGGQTSHTAIVARGLAVPAVVGTNIATQAISDGMMIIIDGNTGMVHLDPDADTIARYRETKSQLSVLEHELQELHDLPAETRDGRRIELSANIELPAELEDVLNHGADGIGLYRTEFLYLVGNELPSEEDQTRTYQRIARRMAPNHVIIRTLDLGADKMPKQMPDEANPALGQRGIRLCLDRPEMFKVQLRAILRAGAEGNVSLMFPMISGLQELRRAKALFEEARNELLEDGVAVDQSMPVGIMVEIPSAALTAHDLAKEVDFFSIGTNDLIQYTVAADRGNPSIASLYNPCHPAVLRLVASVIDAAHDNDIWVGVCGAMAAHPLAACILLGLGVDELSMSPIDIPEIKSLIRSADYQELKTITREALDLSTSEEIMRFLKPHQPKTELDVSDMMRI